MSLEDSWEAILLDRSGDIIAGQLDILEHDGVKARILELSDRLKVDTTLLSDIKSSNAGGC
jgi:hypothetical protein